MTNSRQYLDTDTMASNGAIDPADPPEDVDALYVCTASSSGRRYHVDPDCERLKADVSSRRVEIAAEWYPPCSFCVGDAHPGPSDGGDAGAE